MPMPRAQKAELREIFEEMLRRIGGAETRLIFEVSGNFEESLAKLAAEQSSLRERFESALSPSYEG